MPIQPDTLRKIADASPFPEGRYGEIGAEGMIKRLEDAGMISFLVERSYTERQAYDMCADAKFPSRELERTFYRGQKNYYLCADMDRKSGSGSSFAAAAVATIKREDPSSAQDYQDVLNAEGSAGLFAYIGAEVRRHDLAQVASPRSPELASADEALARRSRGRAM